MCRYSDLKINQVLDEKLDDYEKVDGIMKNLEGTETTTEAYCLVIGCEERIAMHTVSPRKEFLDAANYATKILPNQ